MRETKFRAIIPEKNATIYFSLADLVNPSPLFSVRELLIPWLRAGNNPDVFSGTHDKKGKEIYEGDIHKITNKPEEINQVAWDAETASCSLLPHGLDLWIWADEGVVIGNIYENPELLERQS